MKNVPSILILVLLILLGCSSATSEENLDEQTTMPEIINDSIPPKERIEVYVCDPTKVDINFYWKGKDNTPYYNLGRLKNELEASGNTLLFGMNAGMYQKDSSPLGLYIENGQQVKPLNTTEKAHGNFYLQPNGVFYLTEEHKGVVVSRYQFKDPGNIRLATQSGPMLLIDGEHHPAFREGSSNLNLRNGVGILPDGQLLFAISTEPTNLFDFAQFFKEQGCQNALYLDGFVSKAFIPERGIEQLNGQLGVLIGVTAKD